MGATRRPPASRARPSHHRAPRPAASCSTTTPVRSPRACCAAAAAAVPTAPSRAPSPTLSPPRPPPRSACPPWATCSQTSKCVTRRAVRRCSAPTPARPWSRRRRRRSRPARRMRPARRRPSRAPQRTPQHGGAHLLQRTRRVRERGARLARREWKEEDFVGMSVFSLREPSEPSPTLPARPRDDDVPQATATTAATASASASRRRAAISRGGADSDEVGAGADSAPAVEED